VTGSHRPARPHLERRAEVTTALPTPVRRQTECHLVPSARTSQKGRFSEARPRNPLTGERISRRKRLSIRRKGPVHLRSGGFLPKRPQTNAPAGRNGRRSRVIHSRRKSDMAQPGGQRRTGSRSGSPFGIQILLEWSSGPAGVRARIVRSCPRPARPEKSGVVRERPSMLCTCPRAFMAKEPFSNKPPWRSSPKRRPFLPSNLTTEARATN